MTGPARKSPAKSAGSHNRCWIGGRHAVLETLRAGRWPILEVRLDERSSAADRKTVQELTRTLGIPLALGTADEIERLVRDKNHQGFAGKLGEFPYVGDDDLLSGTDDPAVIVLCGIQDAFNFGAIARSAEVLGMTGILVPTAGQCPVNRQVLSSSAGAVNTIPIGLTSDLVATLKGWQAKRQIRLVAATEKGQVAPDKCQLSGPLAIIVGNEGRGIDPALLEICDEQVCIPQVGQIQSLNAAVSAGILCYEIARQRRGMF
jgi:23S rRNA (guanosine2251-2'-O)-methyltransferase